ARPGVYGLLEGDPIQRQDNAVERQRRYSQSCAKLPRPSRYSSLNGQSEGQGEKSRQEHSHASELADMNGRPNIAGRVPGEYGGVVVCPPTGMKKGNQDVQNLAREQQRGGYAQRCASAESDIVHGSPFLSLLHAYQQCNNDAKYFCRPISSRGAPDSLKRSSRWVGR